MSEYMQLRESQRELTRELYELKRSVSKESHEIQMRFYETDRTIMAVVFFATIFNMFMMIIIASGIVDKLK